MGCESHKIATGRLVTYFNNIKGAAQMVPKAVCALHKNEWLGHVKFGAMGKGSAVRSKQVSYHYFEH